MPGSFTPDMGRTSISVETGFLSQDLKVESIWYTAKKIESMTAMIHVDLDHTDLELEMKLRPAREEASKYSLSTENLCFYNIMKNFHLQWGWFS